MSDNDLIHDARRRDDASTTSNTTPQSPASLAAVLRETAVSRLTSIIEQAVARVSEDLAELAVKTFQYDRQRALGGGASVLSEHGKTLAGAFETTYRDAYDRCLSAVDKPNQPSPTPNSLDELSLVDDGAMTDRVKLSKLVHRTRGRVDTDEQLGVRARYGAMLGRDWLDESEQPLAPEIIYESLNALFVERSDSDPARQALLEGFEPYISANLGDVYIEVNKLFCDNDVLPVIKRRVSLTQASARPSRETAAAEPAAIDASQAAEADDLYDADTFKLPPPGPNRVAVLNILARGVAEGTADARRSAVRVLRDEQTITAPDADGFQVDESLLQFLSSLQASTTLDTEAATPSERLRSLAGGSVEGGSALDQLTVEIVSLIFDYLYHDPRLPEAIKSQLLRLQVVAVKAALLDRSFFASKSHPMRKLIDRATEISCDPDTNAEFEAPFTEGLGRIIDDVLQRFERDLDVFEHAVEQLDELALSEQGRREEQLRAFTEQAERVENERLADDEAKRELSRLVNDLTPVFVRDFLFEYWCRVVAAARLQGPPGEAGRADSLELAKTLIWSVEPKRPGDIAQMASLLPTMVKDVLTGMDGIGVGRERIDNFLNELMRWHTRMISQAKLDTRSPASVQPGESVFSDSAESQTEAAGTSGSANAQSPQAAPNTPGAVEAPTSINTVSSPEQAALDGMLRGQIVEVRQRSKAAIRVKIAWISPGRTLFALSKYPDFARSLSREQMLASLKSGRLSIVEDEGTVERAIRAVESSGEGFPQTTIVDDTEVNTLVMETGIHVPV